MRISKAARCPTASKNNESIKQYTAAMATAAEKHHVVFVDLFAPTGRSWTRPASR